MLWLATNPPISSNCGLNVIQCALLLHALLFFLLMNALENSIFPAGVLYRRSFGAQLFCRNRLHSVGQNRWAKGENKFNIDWLMDSVLNSEHLHIVTWTNCNFLILIATRIIGPFSSISLFDDFPFCDNFLQIFLMQKDGFANRVLPFSCPFLVSQTARIDALIKIKHYIR